MEMKTNVEFRVIDAGINRVSNAAADSIAKQTIMKIDDDIVEACETKQMKKYMLIIYI